MSRSRLAIAAGAAALIAAPFAPSVAHADSDADATAVQGDGGENGSGAIAHSSAESDGESGSASANAIEQDGAPSSEQTGGSTTSGESSGAAFDSAAQEGGQDAPGSIAVAPWRADVTDGDATADSALLRLTFAPDGGPDVTVELLRSHAEADGSTSFASSDGAAVAVGGDQPLAVTFLHAEESSVDGGSAYVVAVNENQVGTAAEVDGQCAVPLPGVLSANCITISEANDGEATTAADAEGGEGVFTAQLVSASAAAQSSSPIFSPTPSPTFTPAPNSSFSTPPSSSFSNTSSLPRTGSETTLLAGLGTLLVAAGLGMRHLGDDFQH